MPKTVERQTGPARSDARRSRYRNKVGDGRPSIRTDGEHRPGDVLPQLCRPGRVTSNPWSPNVLRLTAESQVPWKTAA